MRARARSNCVPAASPAPAAPFSKWPTAAPASTRDRAEQIFEPFFTLAPAAPASACSSRASCAQSNGALLLYEPRPGGGSIFRIVFADPQRWENADD